MSGKSKLILCPYCGNTQTEPLDRCTACGGFFDSLSIKVTQQAMGPWFIRDRENPFRPGCTYEVLAQQIEKGRITANTIIRGPTTRQFWSVARNVPGVAHLVGYCHECGAHVEPTDDVCGKCGAIFFAPRLRDQLGLSPIAAEASITPRPGPGTPEPTAPAESTPEREPISEGSSILRDLRGGDVSDTEMPATAAPQTPDVPSPDVPHDAMDWMSSSSAASNESPEAFGQPLGQYGQTSSNRTWVTALLIAMNVFLILAVIAVVVIVVLSRRSAPNDAADPVDPLSPAAPDSIFTPELPPIIAPADGDTFTEPDPTGDRPAADVPSLYARLYAQALEAERIGELNEAARLLQRIQQNAPPADQPDGLATTIKRVKDKIDYERLRQMFAPAQPNQPAPPPPTEQGETNGRNTIFDEVPPNNATQRDAVSWSGRFAEALDMENRGELDDAISTMLGIRRNAPADQRPAELDPAIERVMAAIAERDGRPRRAPR